MKTTVGMLDVMQCFKIITGVLPRALYRHGARFVGADISPEQIAEARRLTEQAGLDIDCVIGPAETLDFPDGSFDAVTACQCYHYFDEASVLPNSSPSPTEETAAFALEKRDVIV